LLIFLFEFLLAGAHFGDMDESVGTAEESISEKNDNQNRHKTKQNAPEFLIAVGETADQVAPVGGAIFIAAEKGKERFFLPAGHGARFN
jgi:hypothetical protein